MLLFYFPTSFHPFLTHADVRNPHSFASPNGPKGRAAHIFTSDLDIEVMGVPVPPDEQHREAAAANTQAGKRQLAEIVAKVGLGLRRSPCCTGRITVIRFARVPLCTARHVKGVELDITVCNPLTHNTIHFVL